LDAYFPSALAMIPPHSGLKSSIDPPSDFFDLLFARIKTDLELEIRPILAIVGLLAVS